MENSELLFTFGIVALAGLLFGAFQMVILRGSSNLTSKISKFFSLNLDLDESLKKEDFKKMNSKQIISIVIKVLGRVLIAAIILIAIRLLFAFVF